MKTNRYWIWRRQVPDNCCPGPWMQTSYSVMARTDKEAESKAKRMFCNVGFHAMSLVAVESGQDPNHHKHPTRPVLKGKP